MIYLPTSSSDEDSHAGSSRDSTSGDWPMSPTAIQSSFPADNNISAVRSAHLSNEFQRLNELLEDVDSNDLKQMLSEKLSRKSSKHIIALGILFPRLQSSKPPSRSHCVRCHKEYRAEDNSACCLRHPTSQVQKVYQDSKGANFVCKVCTLEFRLSRMFFYDEHVTGYYTGFCFTGKHTSDPRLVRYGGVTNTCEEHGCIETYV